MTPKEIETLASVHLVTTEESRRTGEPAGWRMDNGEPLTAAAESLLQRATGDDMTQLGDFCAFKVTEARTNLEWLAELGAKLEPWLDGPPARTISEALAAMPADLAGRIVELMTLTADEATLRHEHRNIAGPYLNELACRADTLGLPLDGVPPEAFEELLAEVVPQQVRTLLATLAGAIELRAAPRDERGGEPA